MENTSSSSKLVAPIAIGAIVLACGSFYGGTQYQKRQTPTGRGGMGRAGDFAQGGGNMRFGGAGGANGQTGGGRMAGAVAGEITAKDDTGFTLKLRDGGSRIVFTASSTTVGKMSAGTLGDLADGNNVTVVGTPNADGSLTANTVQIRPSGEAGMPMMGGMPSPRGGER